jgi:hypothetical protein
MRSNTMGLKWRRGIGGLLCSVLLAGSSYAYEYEEVTVADGGTLSGTIKLAGDIPKPKGYNLVTFPDPLYCGRISDGRGWRLLQTFHIGAEQAFEDVVVLIEGIEKGKKFEFKTPRVKAIDCMFKPFTTVVWDRHPVEVINMDPVMHDIQAYETSQLGPRVLFNVPLPMNLLHPKEMGHAAEYHRHLPGEPMKQTVHMTKGRRVFVMQCGFHAYMESWGLAVDNPYYAVTGQDGRFEITDVPPGMYKVFVWHPQIGGMKEYQITVEPKGQAKLDVTIEAPTGRLYANEAVENPRFSLRIMGDVRIVPTLEKQSY